MKKITKLLIGLSLLSGLAACNNNTSEVYYDKNVIAVNLPYSDEIILELGESIIVEPTITYKDDKEAKIHTDWSSSRPNVASVNNGVVTALKGGSSIITFMAGYKSAYFKVTINSDEIITPPSTGNKLTLSTYNRSVQENTTFELKATLDAPNADDQTVTFESSDETVAIVQSVNGTTAIIKGVREGTATINVKGADQNASCVVTVTKTPVDPDEEDYDDYDCTIFFFVDYNNIDEDDTTGTKLLAKFGWYHGEPIANSGKVPANPTTALDPAFPYFVGWSTHTIIDTKDDLCDLSTYVVDNAHFLFIYGIWADVEVMTE